MKFKRKVLSILTVMSMLLVLLVPLAAPAGAYSVNRASKVVSIADDFNGDTGVSFELKEDTKWVSDFVYGDVFQLVLSDGVKWNAGAETLDASTGAVCETASIVSDQVLEITFTDAVDAALVNSVVVPMDVEVDGAVGDLTVQVDPIDSGVSSGTYVFARVSGDKSTAKALSVETIGDPGTGGDIRIEEASLGSLGDAEQYIKFKLPSDFAWDGTPAVSFSGGFNGAVYSTDVDGNESVLTFTPPADRTTRGMITVKTPINPDKDANYGDVEVDISGSACDDHDVLVAKYADYGVKVSIDEVKEIFAGKFNKEISTITIEETVSGTLVDGRDITLVFPEWVKITDADIADTNITVTSGTIDGTDNELDISIDTASTGGKPGKIEIDLEISVLSYMAGDIEIVVDGAKAGIPEDTRLVVAKAIPPGTAALDGDAKDLKIGIQNQSISDIIITETKKEAFLDDPVGFLPGNICLTLPRGIQFASKPKVEVVEGYKRLIRTTSRWLLSKILTTAWQSLLKAAAVNHPK